MIAGLEERTRAAFPDDPSATHLDYVELWQASGKTLNRLALELSAPLESPDPDATDATGALTVVAVELDSDGATPISGQMISRHLDKTFGADVTDRTLSRARAHGSHRLVDESMSIADGVQSKDDVPAARLQVSARQWTAEKWNAAEFGQKGASVTLNVAQLHLAALQAVSMNAVPAEKVTGAIESPENNTGTLASGSSQSVAVHSISELE